MGWDIIVVGAGSAGAPLAVRSAERGKRVLLLEAGPDYRSAQMHEAWRSPNPVRALLDPSATEGLVWMGVNSSRTDKQAQAPYWRGRGVGGSSSINGQIAIRPPMEDFDDWAAAGCAGWSWQDVLPYFAKLEDDEEFGDEPYHGRGGPTPIFRMPRDRWGGADSALCAAALAAGHPWAPDVNAPHASGVSPYPINSRAGRRVTVEEGLERAAGTRFGLAATVYTNDPAHMAAAHGLPAGVVWVNQWQGGGPERLYEPAGDSGMGATGSRAAYDAATRPVSIHAVPAAPGG
ncbi:aldehyde dehydrogenase family protein [Nonomuraea sp. CA-141351]|uniref:aldehyde dehydrogenase family protein n=1 Tax=Nonomuraea sp. CA-141351 TaxID=3239996 RepID=UPI003D91844A